MKVLVVKVSALGDIIHALPVLSYLHQVCPGVEVDWVVEEAHRSILEGHPLLRTVYCVKTRAWRKSPFSPVTGQEIGTLRRELKAQNYDVVCDLQGNFKSGLITWLSGGKRRFGFDRDGVREVWNLFFTTDRVSLRPQDKQVSARSLRVVSIPFRRDYAPLTLSSQITTWAEDDEAATAIVNGLPDGLVFLLHNGTTWKTKLWCEQGWIGLGREILAAYPGASVLLSWGNEQERLLAERIAAEIGAGAVVLPKLSLKRFCALLKRVAVVVAGDTGPVHMAAAVGTPTVSFYRATDGERNAPRGRVHVHVQSPLPCTACLRKECDRDAACRDSITVPALMDGIRKVVAL